MTSGPMDRRAGYALPAASGIVMLLLIVGYLHYVVDWFQTVKLDSRENLAAARGLYLWSVASLTVLAAIVWNIGLSFATIVPLEKRLASSARIWLWAAMAVSLLLVTTVGIWLSIGGEAADTFIAKLNSSVNLRIDRAATLNNVLGGCYVTALIFANTLVAGASSACADSKDVFRLFRRYSLLLWSASVLLVLAVVQIFVLFDWAASLAGDSMREETSRLARSLPAAAGFLFSTMLCALFVPVAIVQNGRLHDLWEIAKKRDKDLKREEWLSEIGFVDGTPIRAFAAHIAMFVPLLSGMLASFVGFLWKQ